MSDNLDLQGVPNSLIPPLVHNEVGPEMSGADNGAVYRDCNGIDAIRVVPCQRNGIACALSVHRFGVRLSGRQCDGPKYGKGG